MRRRVTVAVVVLVVVLLVASLWLLGGRENAVDSGPATPSRSPPSAAPAAPPASTGAPAVARVRVPRPSQPGGRLPQAPRPPSAAPEVPPPAADQMVDRRADAPPDAAAVREALMDQMDVVKAAILPCVNQWSAVEPTVAGAVTLAFQLDADGLTDVWIQDHAAVPDALLSCFADAVYASDWAGISREPLQVTWPFQVSDDGDDNGPKAR